MKDPMNFRRVHDPLISIVMPVYNADKYLVQAVASIIEQSLAGLGADLRQ